MRLSEILHRKKEPTKKSRARPQLDLHSVQFSSFLTKLAKSSTKDAWVNHFRKLDGRRISLSKSRYMAGLQCHKKLWQSVYDPEPLEEAPPGTVKWMGTEVGIKARLLWPGGVLVDTKYDDYAEPSGARKP